MMKAVIYGAGNIGRGFIGQLFSGAGYRVTFIDVDEKIINSLNAAGKYPVRFLSDNSFREVWVENVNAVNAKVNANGSNGEEAEDSICEADIMATAVGVRALKAVAPIIANGLKKRFRSGAAPLNIIVCENLIDADKYLAQLVKENLNADEGALLEERVGFVEASIGRMVPIQTPEMQEGNILRVCCEEYAFLPVNKDAFAGKIPEIEGMLPFSNFGFFIQRKLFIHNMGHAVCAYMGLLLGDAFISDTASRPDVLFIAQNAMLESALALNMKFNFPLQDIFQHVKDLLCRFNNRALKDTCARVGADIERKLGASDRLIGAILCCKEQDVKPAFISIGAAAALHCLLKERALPGTEENAAAVLAQTSSLEKESIEAKLILDLYLEIAKGAKPGDLIQTALRLGNKEGVI